MKYNYLNLKDILTEKGYIRGPFGSALKRAELKSEGIPVYEQQNAIYDNRNFRYFIDNDKFNELKRFQVQTNDLIISCSGTVGKVSIINRNDNKGIISQALLILRPNTEIVTPLYLYYFFTSQQGRHSLLSRSTGSVQVNIAKRNIIEMITLPLPNLNIQNRIASILNSLDAKIELNNQIISTLEKLASTLFKRWFVDFEFPDKNGNPYKSSGGKMVDSELGEIPEVWEVKKLGELIEVKYGKDHKKLADGEYPVYGSGGIMRYVESFLFSGESVLIPRKGSLNNIMYVNEAFWSVDTMFFTKMSKNNLAKFIYLFFKRIDLVSMNVGSAVPSMTTAVLNNMPIVSPKDSVLEQFEGVLSPIYLQKGKLENEKSVLNEARDALLPRLLSGEIEISQGEDV